MIEPIVAVPWAGGPTIWGSPASPMSFAWTSTSTVWPELVTRSSSTATGKTVDRDRAGVAGRRAEVVAALDREAVVTVNVPVGV